jgi:flagellar biosynthesis chaperone FliJ
MIPEHDQKITPLSDKQIAILKKIQQHYKSVVAYAEPSAKTTNILLVLSNVISKKRLNNKSSIKKLNEAYKVYTKWYEESLEIVKAIKNTKP